MSVPDVRYGLPNATCQVVFPVGGVVIGGYGKTMIQSEPGIFKTIVYPQYAP
jgi:hypothetical protein